MTCCHSHLSTAPGHHFLRLWGNEPRVYLARCAIDEPNLVEVREILQFILGEGDSPDFPNIVEMPVIDPCLGWLEADRQHYCQSSQQDESHVERLQVQSGKPNILFEYNHIMRSINKYTIDVRRQGFIKAIRSQQRELIKARKRAQLLGEQDYVEVMWKFRNKLATLHLAEQQRCALEFLEFVEQRCNQEQFCRDLWAQTIMQELTELVSQSLVRDSTLQLPRLVEKLFEVIYRLLASCDSFLSIIQRHFASLVYALYNYPSQNNLEKACQFFNCADSFIAKQSWRTQYGKLQLVPCQQVIERLLVQYVLEEGYTVDGATKELIGKDSPRWFRNAIKCMEIVYSLLQLDSTRNQTWESQIIREGLFEGLTVFMSRKDFVVENYDSETDSDSFGYEIKKDRLQSEQTNLYFISIILDILLSMERLMEQREVALMQDLLSLLLREGDRCSFVNLTAIKIIKILYEQVIFVEDDLQKLADAHPHLTTLIDAVVSSDYL